MEAVENKLSFYCEILSIHNSSFTLNDVKLAYRECVLKYHPDTNPDNELLNKKFAQIVKAYKYLEKYCKELKKEVANIKNIEFEILKNKYIKSESQKNRERELLKNKKNISIDDINFNPNLNNENSSETSNPKSTTSPIFEKPLKRKINIKDINYRKYLYKNSLFNYKQKFFSASNIKKDNSKNEKINIFIDNNIFELPISEIIMRLNYSTNDNVKLYCIKELAKSNTHISTWALLKAINSDTMALYIKKEILKALKLKSSIYIKRFVDDCKYKIATFINRSKFAIANTL